VRGYVTKRLLIAVVTLVGMSMVIFVLMRLAPGNIVDILFESAGYVDQADKKQLERELGVDRPLVVQYARWMGEVARGDLGKSYRYDMPAWKIIKPRLPVTLELAFLALLFSILLGVPFGVLSAARQDRPLDYVLRVLSLAGLSMPAFWLAVTVVTTPIRSGPTNEVTRPVRANNPKYCAMRSLGARRINSERDAACSGPPAMPIRQPSNK